MHPSEDQQERIKRMAKALDDAPITQEVANHLMVSLLTEISARLEKMDEKLTSLSSQCKS